MRTEEWRPVVGFSDYEVSDLGRVRSYKRVKVRILHPTYNGSGSMRVELAGKKRLVHILVLEAFVGLRPEGMECRHLDGDFTNNKVENLRWGTRSENILDAVRHGTHNNARKTHCKYGHLLKEDRSCTVCYTPEDRRRRRREKNGATT